MFKPNLKRKVAIGLLGAMTLAAVPMPSMAAVVDATAYQQQENQIQPRFTYIVDCMNGFGINNGVATVHCWVNGRVLEATKAKVIAELQVKNGSSWIPVKIWTDTQNSFEAEVYETYNINPNNTYRVKSTFYVWEGSQSESHITISDEKP